jgi:hypothetical protein
MDSSGTISIGLPRGVNPEAGGHFLHGGQSWSGKGVTVGISFGYWSPTSFESRPDESRCRTKIGGMDALVIESNHDGTSSLVAWLLKSGKPYDVVIHVTGPSKERPLFWAVLSTVRRRAKV